MLTMGKHILPYKSFLILENANSNLEVDQLALLDKKVNDVISSNMEAIPATEEIKYFIRENISDLKDRMGDPEFIKKFYAILEKWYTKYNEELDKEEINYVSDTGIDDSEFDKDIPMDDDSEYNYSKSDEDDWEIDF